MCPTSEKFGGVQPKFSEAPPQARPAVDTVLLYLKPKPRKCGEKSLNLVREPSLGTFEKCLQLKSSSRTRILTPSQKVGKPHFPFPWFAGTILKLTASLGGLSVFRLQDAKSEGEYQKYFRAEKKTKMQK